MKKIFTTCVFLLSLVAFAQEAGKAGELLKNEASKNEMQTRRPETSGKRGSGTLDNSNYRSNPNNNNNIPNNRPNPSYDWNQNYGYGYAEIFLRIPERGFYTVEVGDQMSANSSGKYRFFDIIPGLVPISVYGNGYLLYRTRVNVRNNSRLVLDFFSNRGLYLLGTYQLQNQAYGNYGDVWDDMWNSPYNNGNSGQWDPYYGTGNQGGYNGNQGNHYGNVMNSASFNAFLQVVKNTKFADDKVSVIKQQLRNAMVTSEQVKSLLEALTYDKDRVEIGKYSYSRCVDPVNYFVIYPAFQFQSSAQELRDYISKQ
ncbi:DUF4476 domain-containing protein [Epilithonimonas hungarica]|uniref:DUF4476 domain-containing protein n=1 Tax=Epilithonimonas hungarica TaxID=454006 RepID=A0A1G7MM92_9FLAO|nr:DUF4476 domain-containing protein [Epilithonimonas hungarica]SDF62823.1 protein of unknown function [Epilithonimonas hungarica]